MGNAVNEGSGAMATTSSGGEANELIDEVAGEHDEPKKKVRRRAKGSKSHDKSSGGRRRRRRAIPRCGTRTSGALSLALEVGCRRPNDYKMQEKSRDHRYRSESERKRTVPTRG